MDFKISQKTSNKFILLQVYASILVLYIHSNGAKNFSVPDDSIVNTIVSFFTTGISFYCVSAFAFVSGFLFFKDISQKKMSLDYYKSKLKSRFKSIFIPYAVWNTIGVIITILLAYTALGSFMSESYSITFKPIELFNAYVLHEYYGITWYLFKLMMYTLASPVIYYLLKNKFTSIPYLILCFVVGVITLPSVFNERGYDMLLFFSIGAYIAINCPDLINKRVSKKVSITAGVALLILSVVKIFVHASAIGLVMRIACLFCLWLVLDLFDSVKIKDWMKCTIFVYLSHMYVIMAASKAFSMVWNKLGIYSSLGAIVNTAIIPLIVFAILTTIGLFIKKKLNPIWRLLCGNR